MSSPENHPDTPIPASTAVIGEEVNLKNAGSQIYTTAILKSFHLEKLLGHQVAYRNFELKAKAEKTQKGSKMTWIRQNITTSFINHHKLGRYTTYRPFILISIPMMHLHATLGQTAHLENPGCNWESTDGDTEVVQPQLQSTLMHFTRGCVLQIEAHVGRASEATGVINLIEIPFRSLGESTNYTSCFFLWLKTPRVLVGRSTILLQTRRTKTEIGKKQEPATSKPYTKKGIDVFGVEKKDAIHEKVATRLKATDPPGTNLMLWQAVRAELYDEVGEEEKTQYEAAVEALNEKMKEGPPAAELYKRTLIVLLGNAAITENTAFALTSILGHGWGGHGELALFVMGVYRDRSNILKTSSFSTSEKEQAPVFTNRIPDVMPGLRKDLRAWGEDVFPIILDDSLVHVEAADSEDAKGPQLPYYLMMYGVRTDRVTEWAGREVPDGADSIFIRLVRRDQLEEEGAFEEFHPERMTADECKKLYSTRRNWGQEASLALGIFCFSSFSRRLGESQSGGHLLYALRFPEEISSQRVVSW
ncbi:hypothetical protein DFH09DRAFT_1068513 [Mycena vulgaris]|nr:hypothetical protein DFH09DRAFT_1068513 [Mycena vulgaris]